MTFLNKNFLECLQHDISSFRLFKDDISGLHRIKYFFPQTQITFLCHIGIRSSLFYFTPFDVVLNVLVFQVPHMFAKFGCVSIPFVAKRARVIPESESRPVCIVLNFSYISDCNRFSNSRLMIASNEAWNSELQLNVLDQIIQLFDYISIYCSSLTIEDSNSRWGFQLTIYIYIFPSYSEDEHNKVGAGVGCQGWVNSLGCLLIPKINFFEGIYNYIGFLVHQPLWSNDNKNSNNNNNNNNDNDNHNNSNSNNNNNNK